MNGSRIKFVLVFVAFAFVFLFFTTAILNQAPDAFLGSAPQTGWQAVLSTILSPIKAILIGPLLPFIQFLRQDPDTPPPFFLAGFAFYWAVLAWVIHFLWGQLKTRLSLGEKG